LEEALIGTSKRPLSASSVSANEASGRFCNLEFFRFDVKTGKVHVGFGGGGVAVIDRQRQLRDDARSRARLRDRRIQAA
jgi:hypothetical protein